MSDLSLVNSGRLEIVESIIQMTLPAAEALAVADAVRVDASTGKFTKAKATASDEADLYGLIRKAKASGLPATAIRKGVIYGYDLSGLDYWAKVYLSSTDGKLADADPGEDEVATVTLDGSPGGGTFTLTFGGQVTSAIAYDATAATVEAALEALSTIGQGNVKVTGSAGGPYTVTFIQDLAEQNVGDITADGSSLTGDGDEDVTIEVTNAGIHSVVVGRVIPVPANLGDDYDKLLFVDL